jgi:hypothetical protein
MQPWGLKIVYLVDPSGILWHIAQRRPGKPHDQTRSRDTEGAGAFRPLS